MPPKRPQRRRNKRSGENRSTSVSENCNLTSGATSPSREQFDNTSDDPETRSLEDVTTQQMEGEEEQDNQVSRTFEQATTSLVQDAAGDTQGNNPNSVTLDISYELLFSGSTSPVPWHFDSNQGLDERQLNSNQSTSSSLNWDNIAQGVCTCPAAEYISEMEGNALI